MVLPLLIILAGLFGSLYIFKDEIGEKINPQKSAGQIERERQDAKIRDEKGAFGNTTDFLFGEKNKIPPTPEELQVQKKINERGAFANLQAFFFGEESLKPSEASPNLASGVKTEENITNELQIPVTNNPVVTKNNIIVNRGRSNRQRKSTQLLSTNNQLNQLNTNLQQKGDTTKKPVVGTSPNQNTDNIMPKNKRVSANIGRKTTTKITKKPQSTSKEETQKVTQPSENLSNTVPIRTRRSQSVFNPTVSPNNEIPVEQTEDDVRIG